MGTNFEEPTTSGLHLSVDPAPPMFANVGGALLQDLIDPEDYELFCTYGPDEEALEREMFQNYIRHRGRGAALPCGYEEYC